MGNESQKISNTEKVNPQLNPIPLYQYALATQMFEAMMVHWSRMRCHTSTSLRFYGATAGQASSARHLFESPKIMANILSQAESRQGRCSKHGLMAGESPFDTSTSSVQAQLRGDGLVMVKHLDPNSQTHKLIRK